MTSIDFCSFAANKKEPSTDVWGTGNQAPPRFICHPRAWRMARHFSLRYHLLSARMNEKILKSPYSFINSKNTLLNGSSSRSDGGGGLNLEYNVDIPILRTYCVTATKRRGAKHIALSTCCYAAMVETENSTVFLVGGSL